MTALSTVPLSAVPAAWASLPPETQAEIGNLVLREALLRYAGDQYKGDEPGTLIVYLGLNGREEAWNEADATLERVRDLLWDRFPDLFGENPSTEHPNGTDPPWATMIVWPDTERDELLVVTEERS